MALVCPCCELQAWHDDFSSTPWQIKRVLVWSGQTVSEAKLKKRFLWHKCSLETIQDYIVYAPQESTLLVETIDDVFRDKRIVFKKTQL